jgi:nucleotide-binding universal stress UspA family protein
VVRERGFTCQTVVPYGHAAECIVEQARIRDADLIVMATHGCTGPGRWIFGSVAESVVAGSPVPVLVQRAWQPVFGDPMWNDQPEVVVTLDGSVFAETALDPAAGLAADLGARLVLVRAETDPSVAGETMAYLAHMQARLAASYPALPIESDLRIADSAAGIEEAIAHPRPG